MGARCGPGLRRRHGPGNLHPRPSHRRRRPLGTQAFGARNGILAGATMAAAALAPWAGSFLADHVGGHAVAFWYLAGGMLLAAAGVRPAAQAQ